MSKKNTRKKKTFQGNKKHSKDKTRNLVNHYKQSINLVSNTETNVIDHLPNSKNISYKYKRLKKLMRKGLWPALWFILGNVFNGSVDYFWDNRMYEKQKADLELISQLEQSNKHAIVEDEMVFSTATVLDDLLRVLEHVHDAHYLAEDNVYYIDSSSLSDIWLLNDNMSFFSEASIGSIDPLINRERIQHQNFINTKVGHIISRTEFYVNNDFNNNLMKKYGFNEGEGLFLTSEDKADYFYFLYSEIFSIDFQQTLLGRNIPYKINNFRVFPKIKKYVSEIENRSGKDVFERYCEVCTIKAQEKPEGEVREFRMDDLPKEFLEKYNLQKYRE